MNKTYPLLPPGNLMSADNLNSFQNSYKELINLGVIPRDKITKFLGAKRHQHAWIDVHGEL